MSMAPQAQYFLLTTNLSRGQDDATTKKKMCTRRDEYYRRFTDSKTGLLLLESVSVFDDGLAYHSPPAPFSVPVGADSSTARAYHNALKKAQANTKKRKEAAAKEKEQREKVEAMRRGLAELAKAQRSEASVPVTQSGKQKPEALVQVLSKAMEEFLAEPTAPPVAGLLDDFTVIDTEFVPEGQHLLEVAAIRYVNMEPREAFVSFVSFAGRIPHFVTELTGITALHLFGAPSEQRVLFQLREYVGDSLLVCHNVPADRGVIEKTRARLGKVEPLPNSWLCTMALARRLSKAGLLPKAVKFGLADLCHHFKIKRRGEHRAKADVLMSYQLLRKLHELQPVTKADLFGAPQPGKSHKTPAGPGLLFAPAA